jgi:hypothetical protein
LLFLLLVVLCISSCVDIEENYNFKADGSCNVVYGFDMSNAVSVLMNLMSDSVRATPQFSMVKDTSLNFYSALPDSTQLKMNIDEINMAKSSNLAIKMDLRKSIMKVSITHLSKNAADLQYYLQHISKISMSDQLNEVTKNSKGTTNFDAQQLVAGQAFLKKTSSTFAMAKAMLIDMPYKIVLNFAKPVKKVNNPKAIVSADRKRVTLITDMDEVIKNPSIMNLKIDF